MPDETLQEQLAHRAPAAFTLADLRAIFGLPDDIAITGLSWEKHIAMLRMDLASPRFEKADIDDYIEVRVVEGPFMVRVTDDQGRVWNTITWTPPDDQPWQEPTFFVHHTEAAARDQERLDEHYG